MRVADASEASVTSEKDDEQRFQRKLRRYHWGVMGLGALAIIFLIWAIIATAISFTSSSSGQKLVFPKTSSAKFRKAAVASDNVICSNIGRNVIAEGGNAVDAAIAVVFCNGVVNPFAAGIGGGAFFVAYMKSKRKCVFINGRETAPAASTENMYVKDKSTAQLGYLSAGIPGELHALWTAYTKYGSKVVPWARLVRPSANVARGYPCSNAMINYFPNIADLDDHRSVSPLKRLFTNPLTGEFYAEGEIISNMPLAKTLEAIANASDPVALFYKGHLGEVMVQEMAANEGIITAEDMANYRSDVTETLYSEIGDFRMCGPPPPSSWAVTQAIPRIVEGLYVGKQIFHDAQFYHQLIEAEKLAYGIRTHLGDGRFDAYSMLLAKNLTTSSVIAFLRTRVKSEAQPLEYYSSAESLPADHGTSHSSILDDDGDAVSVTSTVNMAFGSKMLSPLGFVWNNQMDDFSTPGLTNHWGYKPTESNFIKPGRRPMSSMSPTIVFDADSGDVKMVTGAAGGAKIITATAQSIVRCILLLQNAAEIIEAPRIHNQLEETTLVDADFHQKIVDVLKSKYKQKVEYNSGDELGVANVITRESDGSLTAAVDYRRKAGNVPTGY